MEVSGSCSLISPTKAYGCLEGAGSLCPHSPKSWIYQDVFLRVFGSSH